VNKVLLTGRLTRDPEMRSLASGKTVTTFNVSTSDAVDGAEGIEHHAVVTWV
jgi:single-stranded DNA-binding protein